MNNRNTRIILINQYFRLFFKFYTPPISNLYIHQFSRHACVKGNTYFLISVRFVESATGRSIWLTLFDQCVPGLLDVDAKDFSLMHENMQMSKLNTLVGTRMFLTIKKSKRNGYTNYNVTHLEVLQ